MELHDLDLSVLCSKVPRQFTGDVGLARARRAIEYQLSLVGQQQRHLFQMGNVDHQAVGECR